MQICIRRQAILLHNVGIFAHAHDTKNKLKCDIAYIMSRPWMVNRTKFMIRIRLVF